jgi:putative peptidoglycan lipid II flippase
VWFLTAPATVLLLVLAEDISRILLQYGKFTPTDTQLVASALRAFALGLFAWSGQALIARGFFALRDSLTPVLVGSAVTVVFVPLCVLLMRLQGHVGLALATSIAATLQMVWMARLLNRRIPRDTQTRSEPLARFLVATGAAVALMGLVAFALHTGLHALLPDFQVNLRALVIALVVALLSMWVYLLACKRLSVQEVDYVWRVFKRS